MRESSRTAEGGRSEGVTRIPDWNFLSTGAGAVAGDAADGANDGAIAGGAAWTTTCPAAGTASCAALGFDGTPSNLPKACISLDVDGVNDVVHADHLSATKWTLEAWVYPQKGAGQQAIVTQLDSTMGKREGFDIGIENALPYVFSPDGMDFDGKVTAVNKVTLNQCVRAGVSSRGEPQPVRRRVHPGDPLRL